MGEQNPERGKAVNKGDELRPLLRAVWVEWCRQHGPGYEVTPFPAEAFLAWAGRQLNVEVAVTMGDDEQFKLLESLDFDVANRWPRTGEEEDS